MGIHAGDSGNDQAIELYVVSPAMPFSIKTHHRLTTAVQQHRTQRQRKNPRVNTMKTSCVLALLPLLCGLVLAQGEPLLLSCSQLCFYTYWPLSLIVHQRSGAMLSTGTHQTILIISSPFPVTCPSLTIAPARGVPCPFVDIRSQWLKSAYAAG